MSRRSHRPFPFLKLFAQAIHQKLYARGAEQHSSEVRQDVGTSKMVQTYKITITNASEVPRQFFLVHGVPSSESVADESAFDHAYQRSVKIMGDGTSSATFVLDDNYYAICGTKVGLSGGRPPVPGGFTISTDDSFTYPNKSNIYIGLGAIDPVTGNVVPVETFAAMPKTTSQIYPKPVYTVFTGRVKNDTTISEKEFGSLLRVDFSNATIREAIFTLDACNQYVPSPRMKSSGITYSVDDGANST
ncbi:unnamed protein product [Parascedosporium putredinis]|uniref:Uncharacterized protein n=1 Tax=Parascedosporium putredinis TaxID=1442378 RepID=A0A9P1H3J8_9PEZI|nr:unnamed protein product [Parascedosporium putredinis]CAI7995921.1 unnamed protein product [Parascedosporium putredinis]